MLRAKLRGLAEQGRLPQALENLSRAELSFLLHDWPLWARPHQLPPDAGAAAHWTVWLLLGGRGAGKTRAGAEWVRARALGHDEGCVPARSCRIALVAPTLADARAVMVEGVSGLLSVHADHERPSFEPSLRRLTWPNGSIAEVFSAEEPDSLRGPQFDAAWCDELCRWRYPDAAWDMLQFALRLGERPRQVVTTTPRPMPLLKRLLADERTALSRMRTADNACNLSPAFLDAVVGRYRGTRLGRQELDAEILEDRADALWTRSALEQSRVASAPELTRIVVAVDPPAASTAASDACGIVAAGKDTAGKVYVLRDATASRLRPAEWAARAVALFHELGADRIVAEVNQGGDMVTAVIGQIDAAVPVLPVRARRGKWTRAEPVAALYERSLVAHVGSFPELEDELCMFAAGGFEGQRSPDRADALVWAVWALALSGAGGAPRIRSF